MYVNINKKYIIILSIFFTLLVIFTISVLCIRNQIKYGKKIILNDDILNLSSYYAEYEATIISNKNTNTYQINEWYKKDCGSRIEYLDYMKNIIKIITTEKECYVSNSGNDAYILVQNIYGKNNILSLSTYVDIFNKNITCGCTKNVYKKDGEINVIYSVCLKENCMQSDDLRNMGIAKLELNIKNNKPLTYTVYNKDKKQYSSILYNKFETNILIEDDVFYIKK